MVWTNTGKKRMFESWFSASAGPSSFVLMASTSGATTWDADLSSTANVTLVSPTNGYTASGIGEVLRDGIDFTVSSDFPATVGADWAQADLKSGYQLSADGGTINNVHYVLLADGEETDVDAREIFAFWSTGSDLDIGAGNTVSITNASLRGT